MTLYQSATYIRRAVVAFLIFAIAITIANTVSNLLTTEELDPFNPNVSPWQKEPLNSFSELTFPAIKAQAISTEIVPEFDITGVFPGVFPDTALIYRIEKPRERLNSTARAESAAERLGFLASSLSEDNRILTWTNSRQTRSFKHDLTNRVWSLSTLGYFQDANALRPKSISSSINYGLQALSMFSSLGLSNDTFANANTTYENVVRSTDRFIPPRFNQTAEYSYATIYRRLLMSELHPGLDPTLYGLNANQTEFLAYVYSNNPYEGSVTIVISDEAADPTKDIYELNFVDYEYTQDTSYYLLKSPEVAWQDVQTGNAALVSIIPRSSNRYEDIPTQTVTRFTADASLTELAYYEGDSWLEYTFPIFIIRGVAELSSGDTADVVFYVDALRD